jgi:hypothetical protein
MKWNQIGIFGWKMYHLATLLNAWGEQDWCCVIQSTGMSFFLLLWLHFFIFSTRVKSIPRKSRYISLLHNLFQETIRPCCNSITSIVPSTLTNLIHLLLWSMAKSLILQWWKSYSNCVSQNNWGKYLKESKRNR